MTGSGKTEVYIRLARRALEMGKGCVVLVPEIALTPQMAAWFHQRFGADAAVLHSGLSAGERRDEWLRIRRGEARVVVGARSAVFAPIQNLGAIVIDEEHEGSYQSDRRPRYDAREVAWRRAQAAGAVLVLGSATPSIATYMRAMPGVRPENRLALIELPERVGGRPLPGIEVVDMRREFERGNRSIFSALLSQALRDCVDRGRQAMLLINRRGHSSFVSCRKCGYVVKCPACDVSMTYHQRKRPALPLLRGRTPRAAQVPRVRKPVHQVFRRGHGAGGRRGAPPASRGDDPAHGLRYHAHKGRPRQNSRSLPAGRGGRAGGHADDRQRAGFSQRHPLRRVAGRI